MKKIAFLYLSLLAVAFASIDDDYAKDLARFRSLVSECDKLIISPDPFAQAEGRCGVTIDGAAAVAKIARSIKVSEKLLCRDTSVERGREVVMRPSCGCFGSGDLMFFQSGLMVVRARIYHWKTLSVESDYGSFTLDLLGQSEDSKAWWDFLFPEPKAHDKKG